MKRIAILVASAAFALPASAADIIYNEPMAPAPMDPISFGTAVPQWTGFYVGGQLGAGAGLLGGQVHLDLGLGLVDHLHVQVGGGEGQPVAPGAEQDVGQDRNGVAAFDHALDVAQGLEERGTFDRKLHVVSPGAARLERPRLNGLGH